MQWWQDVDQRQARLSLDRFTALVDPWNAAGGLRDAAIDGAPFPDFHPLGIELPDVDPSNAAGVERYSRGRLDRQLRRPSRTQHAPEVYWRAGILAQLGAVATIELVASLQTDLLDSFPELAVTSNLVASEAYQLADAETGTFAGIVPPTGDGPDDDVSAALQCYLLRLPGHQFSYAEMVHPADGRTSDWEGWLHGAEYRLQLRHRLFARPLEKGVILRARVLGVVVPRQNDRSLVARYWKAFLAEAPPLTA